MSTNTCGVMFGIWKVENYTPIGGVFLWNNPNGINLEVGKRGGDERASCVTQLYLF